jgi:MFS family permease
MENSSSENTASQILSPSTVFETEKPTLKTPLKETGWRWVALFLMNLLVFGGFVSMDNPQPLEKWIEMKLNIDEQTYSLLYSIWALPSIIVPFFGGYLTDKLGVRPALLIFGLALTVGQFVYAYGGYSMDFNWMLAGRAIFAIGSDPLNVAQIVITQKWFQGKEVGLAMALGTTTCGVGRALNSYLVPRLYQTYQTLFAPMLFSALICVVGLIATIVMIFLDKENDDRMEARDAGYLATIHSLAEEENISLKDVKHFKPIVWLLILNFALVNAVFFSFNIFSNELYVNEFSFSNSQAGTIISINFIVTAVSAMFFGQFVDTYGRRASLIMCSSVLGVIAFAYYIIVPECVECGSTIFPMVCFGLLIGINDAAIFPSLPLVLKHNYLGTGYGLFFVLQNVLVLILPSIGATIKDHTDTGAHGEYYWMFVFFGVWAVITVIESVALFIQDRKHGKLLEQPLADEDEEVENNVSITISEESISGESTMRSEMEDFSVKGKKGDRRGTAATTFTENRTNRTLVSRQDSKRVDESLLC